MTVEEKNVKLHGEIKSLIDKHMKLLSDIGLLEGRDEITLHQIRMSAKLLCIDTMNEYKKAMPETPKSYDL